MATRTTTVAEIFLQNFARHLEAASVAAHCPTPLEPQWKMHLLRRMAWRLAQRMGFEDAPPDDLGMDGSFWDGGTIDDAILNALPTLVAGAAASLTVTSEFLPVNSSPPDRLEAYVAKLGPFEIVSLITHLSEAQTAAVDEHTSGDLASNPDVVATVATFFEATFFTECPS